MDNPKGASYYGTAVSAPVFAEVAQQVLEYLSVPHDIDVLPPKVEAKKEAPITEDDAGADQNNVNALFAAVNDLPADDPLRAPPSPPTAPAPPSSPPAIAQTKSAIAQAATASNSSPVPAALPPASHKPPSQVTINDGKKMTVPSLVGLPMRKVIEVATAAGLDVQFTGSGTAREQAPAPGTQVPVGTKIVVRCGR